MRRTLGPLYIKAPLQPHSNSSQEHFYLCFFDFFPLFPLCSTFGAGAGSGSSLTSRSLRCATPVPITTRTRTMAAQRSVQWLLSDKHVPALETRLEYGLCGLKPRPEPELEQRTFSS